MARIARDDETFSSSRELTPVDGTAIVIPQSPAIEKYPLELDPPRSTEYRELINPLLSPDAVDRLRPMIARHAARVVDTFIEYGSCDLVRDFTNPVPAAVTLDWLGFPEEDWAKLAGPIHDIFATVPGSERSQRGAAGLAYLGQRIRELIRDRRAEPRDDAVSRLVATGARFSEDDLVKVIGLLIAGGVDTTTSLTGSTLIHLSRHPEQKRRLIESPDLLDAATDEFLRRFSPSQAMARTVRTDTEVGGCPVHAGDRVLIPWVAANHDPEVFPDPTEVRLDRDASRHLAFGIGSHRCVGAHLARAMFREMMTQVLTRFPDYRVVEEGLVGYPTSGSQTGWDAIPATFTPGNEHRVLDGVALTVTEVARAADDVLSLRLSGPEPLPAWTPGAHVELRLPSGRIRQYSLCGAPDDATSWQIGVLREGDGRGGSAELHEIATVGASLTVRGPRNHFPLVDAPDYLFLAGGIGVTPILAMVRAVAGRPFRVVYGGRTRSSMAFTDELSAAAGDRLTLLPADETGMPDLDALLGGIAPDTAVYCCGPAPMIAAVEAACAAHGVTDRLHVERFAAELDPDVAAATNTAFEVHLARSGVTLPVPPGKRLLEVVREAVPGLSYDCEKGYCGACETRVLAGVPEHRDSVLTEEERASGRTMMICVGRSSSDRLVLDR
ncbi:cytochrome P450 [Cryptosporangium phraense]|uniref:Cytochrome P450 n=1 Tax=Cryptosporangium phraense TaxID=2593070 RepID=A0A545AQ50_9ACTN|nr:cytochrome P450 [Cryptosporangium phraense]